MVSWESIVEIIAEDQYDQDAGNDGPLSAHLVRYYSSQLCIYFRSLYVFQSLYGLSSKEDPVPERFSADSELTSLRVRTQVMHD